MKKINHISIQLFENIFFLASLSFLIPVIPSDITTEVEFSPQGYFAIILFVLSRILSFLRGGEKFWSLSFQIIGFIIFVWTLFLRFEIGFN
jgi:hypothetical protein